MSEILSEKILITTPIYYVNAKAHLGHAYTTILGDTLGRYYRQRGKEVFFLTGTDEHGEKIAASAQKRGVSPQEFVNETSASFERTWKTLDLHFDRFYRTTQPSHYTLVQNALQYLKQKGEITFASYTGKYCVGCERFRTDQEWNEQGLCPDHLSPPEMREESNYFFKMSLYQKRLKEFYEQNPGVVEPRGYLRELLSFLDQPLEDLCISRPTSRLEWGIPLPFDNKFVTYVWFDALLNYPGGVGFEGRAPGENPNFREDLWANTHHLIGKDILKTHGIYWPTMLMALGLPLFQRLEVNGYWLMNDIKMSKSLGNVVDPVEMKDKIGMDAFRFYLLREMSYGADSSLNWESVVGRVNADLANGIGNLASRVLTLVHKNLEARVPSRKGREDYETNLLQEVHGLVPAFARDFEACRYHMALASFGEAVAKCDRYINDQKPWALAKDPAQKDRLAAVLGTAMDALWTLSVVGASFLPEGCRALSKALGRESEESPDWESAEQFLPEGSLLGEVPRLYPRLDLTVLKGTST